MKALKITFITIGIIIILAVVSLWYVGFFTKINIQEKEAGGYVLAGEEIIGSYSKVGPVIMKVDKKLKDMGLSSTKGFGIYYDNPKTTPQAQRRSYVGNIIETKDLDKIEVIKTQGLKVDSVPLAKSLVVEFPIRNQLSYMIGPMRAYPKLMKYAENKGFKIKLAMEVYDIPSKQIIFIMQYQ